VNPTLQLRTPVNKLAVRFPENVFQMSLTAGAAPVQSVAGRTGNIVLGESDVTGLTLDLASKANTASLAAVAFTGNYSDLSGTPAGVLLAANDLSDVPSPALAFGNLKQAATFASTGVVRQTVYNVRDFLAVLDGVTDDTTAIQNALNTAPAGATVWVPYTSTGAKCGALTLPAGVRLQFDQGAKFIAPSSMAASWVKAAASTVHEGTPVIGGTFDATACTNSGVNAVIDFSAVTSAKSPQIRNNRVINAPKHGIFIAEATKTLDMKWITGNSIEEHGVASTGFGIYADYIGNVLIDGNYVYSSGVDDSIELGHSGPAWLGINAHLRCTNNTVVGGQINYPFSDYVEIVNNTVNGNTIQNDGNTANYVQIMNNKVFNAAPASSYAGISHWGTDGQIIGNYIMVTTGNGIGGSWSHEVITGNKIISSSGTNTGYAIYPGGGGAQNTISGNLLMGSFAYGIYMPFVESTVTGNSINTYNGIQVNGVEYTVITGNSFNVGNQVMVGTPGIGTSIFNNGGSTVWGTTLLAASLSSQASLNMPQGVAPVSPNDGDWWYASGHVYAHIGGVTQQIDQQAVNASSKGFAIAMATALG
jgi:hypothetical protein